MVVRTTIWHSFERNASHFAIPSLGCESSHVWLHTSASFCNKPGFKAFFFPLMQLLSLFTLKSEGAEHLRPRRCVELLQLYIYQLLCPLCRAI
jgi:hypothetical protein